MSIKSSNFSAPVDQDDPKRMITISLRASEAYMIRYIAAILADEKCDDEGRNSIVRGCGATAEDMMRIHHRFYCAGMKLNADHLDL